MSMIKWQLEAINVLLNDDQKIWGSGIDVPHDTVKNLTGAA